MRWILAFLLISGGAWAQTTPPQGVLRAPPPGPKAPEKPVTPPKAAPVTPVQRVAPVQEGSALGKSTPGTSTPGKATPVVTSKGPAKAAPPPKKPGSTAKKVAVAAGAAAVAGTAVAAAAAKPAAKPAEKTADKPADPAEKPPAPQAERAPVDPNKGSATGQPLPRWAALRSDVVNLRKGPGQRYPIEWEYHRRDLPVLIEREFEVWRLVSDPEGVKGWVHSATLTGRRSFVVKGPDATLRSRGRDDADPVALLKSGVVGHITACAATADWCEVAAGGFKGWLKRTAIFGISPGEAVGS